MQKVFIYTSDKYLRRKIELILEGKYDAIAYGEDVPSDEDILILDLDSAPADGIAGHPRKITLSHRDGISDLPLPLPLGALEARLNCECGDGRGKIEPVPGERAVLLYGERIKLTEHEHALFMRLFSSGGEYVPRRELSKSVFGDGENDRMLNLYIHYLREKLETGGEKIILSSRKLGYKIDGKYLKEG